MKRFLIYTIILILLSTTIQAYVESTHQFLPTKLRIFVRNGLGNLEEGVSVTLFKTEEDYEKEENPVGEEQITDSKGRVTFVDLEPITYYILAKKDDLNNHGGGIQTDNLKEGRLNKTTIVID